MSNETPTQSQPVQPTVAVIDYKKQFPLEHFIAVLREERKGDLSGILREFTAAGLIDLGSYSDPRNFAKLATSTRVDAGLFFDLIALSIAAGVSVGVDFRGAKSLVLARPDRKDYHEAMASDNPRDVLLKRVWSQLSPNFNTQ